jgi:hypothetical protein
MKPEVVHGEKRCIDPVKPCSGVNLERKDT